MRKIENEVKKREEVYGSCDFFFFASWTWVLGLPYGSGFGFGSAMDLILFYVELSSVSIFYFIGFGMCL